MTDRPPATRSKRLPWVVAAVCAVLLVATVVFAVVMLSGGSDDSGSAAGKTTTYQPGGAFPATPGKYRPGKITNSCDALDFSAIEKLGFPAQGKPVHTDINAGNTGSLECQAGFENASLTGQASFEASEDPEVFDELKTSTINTPPVKSTAGEVTGLGRSAYYTVQDYSGGTMTHITATIDMQDANLNLRTTFKVDGTDLHLTPDDVRKAAENQAHVMLDRLR